MASPVASAIPICQPHSSSSSSITTAPIDSRGAEDAHLDEGDDGNATLAEMEEQEMAMVDDEEDWRAELDAVYLFYLTDDQDFPYSMPHQTVSATMRLQKGQAPSLRIRERATWRVCRTPVVYPFEDLMERDSSDAK